MVKLFQNKFKRNNLFKTNGIAQEKLLLYDKKIEKLFKYIIN